MEISGVPLGKVDPIVRQFADVLWNVREVPKIADEVSVATEWIYRDFATVDASLAARGYGQNREQLAVVLDSAIRRHSHEVAGVRPGLQVRHEHRHLGTF